MKVYDSPVTAVTGGSVGLNRRVALSSSGTLVHAGPGEMGVGTFTWDSYPSAGLASAGLAASGTRGAVSMFSTGGVFRMIGASSIAVGAVIYAAADGKVNDTGLFPVGIARTACLGDGEPFQVWVAPRADALLYGNTAASSAITGTSAATNFSLSPTIPANSLKSGDRLEIDYAGIITAINGTDTLATRLLIGSSPLVLGSIGAATGAVNRILVGRAVGQVRGNSGTFSFNGMFNGYIGAAGSAMVASAFNVALDPTVDNAVAVEATWSSNNAGNSCRLDMLSVNLRRQ